MCRAGNFHGPRPSRFSLRDDPIVTSQMTLQGQCTHSGASSAGRFSSGPVTIATHDTLSRQIMRKWEPWKTNIAKSNNHRMLQQPVFHKRQTIKATRVQDLDPRSCADNDHESVLEHEMTAIEPTEIPSRTLTWTPLVYLSHIKRPSHDDRFLVSQWETYLLYPRRDHSGSPWTVSAMCIQHFCL